MSRKSRTAAIFALTGILSACTSVVAFAGGPLLSGYGGPGAGEQAVIGSTLLGGPGAGAGSGRPGGPQASGSGGGSAIEGASSGGSSGAAGSGPSRTGTSPSGKGRTKNVQGATRGLSRRDLASGGESTRAYAYKPTLASQKDDASVIEIPQGDVLPLAGLILALGVVATLTVRISRLQR
jgi:hypothetical protein